MALESKTDACYMVESGIPHREDVLDSCLN